MSHAPFKILLKLKSILLGKMITNYLFPHKLSTYYNKFKIYLDV